MRSIRFRRKRPENTRSAFSAKDWASLAISMVALGLSVVTAYYNLWRQEDNVSLVAHLPPLTVKTADNRLAVPSDSETSLAFVNTGNRPVAIMSVVLVYTQSRLNDGEECPFDAATRLGTDFKPIVVRQNEVVTSIVRVADAVWYQNYDIRRDKDGRFLLPVHEATKADARFPMEICIEVTLTTASQSGHVSRPSVYKYWMEANGGWSWSFDGEGPVVGKPLNLVKESWSLW